MAYNLVTERMVFRSSGPELTEAVLDYYLRNRDFFSKAEPERTDTYFTAEYQLQLQELEKKKIEKGLSAYYYGSLKTDPNRIIFSVSYVNIRKAPYYSTIFGYDLDEELQGHGYATEAILASIDDVLKKHEIHRIEARVLPDNIKSVSILENVGFSYEGIEKSSILLRGKFRDHKRYAYINENFMKEL